MERFLVYVVARLTNHQSMVVYSTDNYMYSVQVKYSGHVEWRTSSGRLLMFEDAGNRSTQSTQLTVAPLVPDTDYRFRVSALTQSGQGQEVVVIATTKMLFGEGTSESSSYH